MQVNDLELPDRAIQMIKDKGIEQLNPPQVKSINSGLLDDKNQVISSPTASGKTLIAEMAIMNKCLNNDNKCVYIVPLRALAQEKYKDFKYFEDLGLKVTTSVGDYDTASEWLGSYDLIITTSEKMDSVLRHNPKWVNDIDLIVSDEIHLLNDEKRGPTLEVTLTRLLQITKAQIIGLSATISNAEEIANWLNAEYVTSNYRPVELIEGVYDGSKIRYFGKDDCNLESGTGELVITKKTVEKDKQTLIFASSRRNAQSIARKSGNTIKHILDKDEKEELEKLADQILAVPSSPTEQCEKLANAVRNGTAFHHAGLANKQKHLIEDAFRDKLLKSISATPTLAMGINLPAYRVIIRDEKRYYPGKGMQYIPTLEYKQMAGRAGRPKYDDFGEAILIAKNSNDAEELRDRFIEGVSEEIFSKLSVEPILRTHVLSLIASYVANDTETLKDFFNKTFFAEQYSNTKEIETKVGRILRRLDQQDFIIKKNDKLEPTKIGERVAQLYLDPESANKLIEGIKSDAEMNPFGLFTLICQTREMRTSRMRKSEYQEVQRLIEKHEDDFLTETPSSWDINYDDFLNAVKTADLLTDWINETNEDKLMERYGETPGGLRTKQEIGDWLLYSCQELSTLLNMKNKQNEINKVRRRLKYGIKEDIIQLTEFEGIGRVRARKLARKGYRNVADIRDVPLSKLKDILGEKTAEKVKGQIDAEEKQTTLG